MKFIGSLVLAAALLMPACATVEIASGDSAPVVETVELEQSVNLRRSAKTLSYTFAKNSWSHTAPHSKAQSAANILLRGLKKDQTPSQDAATVYRQSTLLPDVKADVIEATKMVHDISTKGYRFLTENPDHNRVRRDLAALEKALVAARQAEMTFEAALKSKTTETDLLKTYAASVDSLRSVTDAFGDRQRSAVTTQPAS